MPSVATSRLPDLSKDVVAYLNTTFSGTFVAVHNSNVVYQLPELSTLRVNVWPSSLDRPRLNRAAFARMPGLMIAIQKRAADQDAMDVMTNLVDDILDSILGRRFLNGVYFCKSGDFSNELFDRFEKFDENVFQSVIAVSFELWA